MEPGLGFCRVSLTGRVKTSRGVIFKSLYSYATTLPGLGPGLALPAVWASYFFTG